MKYTVDYFIEKFEAIPEEKWFQNDYEDGSGRFCALGHCGQKYLKPTDESIALSRLVDYVSMINDGYVDCYQQANPKQRILAALYNIKKLQNEETT